MAEIRLRINKSREERSYDESASEQSLEEKVRTKKRNVVIHPRDVVSKRETKQDPIKLTRTPSRTIVEKNNTQTGESTEELISRLKKTANDVVDKRLDAENKSIDQSDVSAPSIYTNDQIKQFLIGYLQINRQLYDYVPIGAHVRYYRKCGDARSFKLGGFVQNHVMVKGKPAFVLETVPGSCVSCMREPAYKLNNHVTYVLTYDDIDELWKKYDSGAFIEIHLMYGSLLRKDKKIAELEARVEKLEASRRK